MNTLTDKFLRGLHRGSGLHAYWNLFSLLEISDPSFLDEIVENYKIDPEDYFRVFHKTFRQCDVFTEDFAVISYTNSQKIEVVERIGGHLDSVFYETIHSDNGILMKYVDTFFKENII